MCAVPLRRFLQVQGERQKAAPTWTTGSTFTATRAANTSSERSRSIPLRHPAQRRPETTSRSLLPASGVGLKHGREPANYGKFPNAGQRSYLERVRRRPRQERRRRRGVYSSRVV